ncbi:DMT family transporter [Ramlibacter sp.]|uniref:DMT family transporter n=1 Tax=Ramlibacter sp. TaxID=1917967 RepID=UPI002C00FFC3|nr:DMT family transporter [Ramlibacter sp.]HWI82199.1 DMT family transporter [Ramlibacter sp.]
MQRLSRQQLVTLVLLTLTWGLNWPVMKLGVSNFPALSFRAVTVLAGLPVLAAVLLALKVPFRVPRRSWGELFWLALTNMVVWNVCMILALRSLSSGRAAILAYTMPIFSAVFGALLFHTRLAARGWLGVGAAAVGVALLLWHEFTVLAGRPWGVALALFSAAVWALGTQLLRRSRIEVPTLTLSFWMTALSGVVATVLAVAFERQQWQLPGPAAWGAIAYNAILIFGFSQAAWLSLARNLPPVASTLSVMFIPVLGVFVGALWLGEVLHWQDWAAVLLMVVAIASVLWPGRPAPAAA